MKENKYDAGLSDVLEAVKKIKSTHTEKSQMINN